MSRASAAVRSNAEQPTKKQREVLNVASDYFLAHGYQGTSINAMARESGISKESIYRYFSSKKALFEAVVAKELKEYRERLNFVDMEHDSMPLAEVLQQIGESIMQAVTSDRVLGLRRLVFQEAALSPEIGQHYYATGPRVAYGYLENLFSERENAKQMDPKILAFNFVAVILHRFMLQRECRVIEAPTNAEISQHVAEVTDDFLKLHFAQQETDRQ
ncbi:MAG: TetR/AcrR family transcriptional regulator [Woeseiaceae bacterium]|jgi:TetR/AcrR family transcriptional repressor of mexJK operon